jgi:hypothetical protein
MNSRRNTVAVAIIALIAGLFASTWSAMAGFDPVPVLVPSGVYTGVRVPPAENPFMMTVIPMDPAGNTLTTIQWSDMGYPSLGIPQPPFSECDSMTEWLGNMLRTGPTTWTGTAIAYGTKKVEGQPNPEPIWLAVDQMAYTFSDDDNTVLMEGSTAVFLPEQDKDGDGWPDEDEVPVWCGEAPGGANTAMRMPTAFPWEPTPPRGQ